MSAILNDAADIPTNLPHPTGAATVIDINSVPLHSTATPNPATATASPSAPVKPFPAPAANAPSSPSAPAPATDSRLEPRNFPLEQHQAAYRAHAYFANESTVVTKIAADKFLQALFTQRNDPDKDILRAASFASRARLQNPFAYNNSKSSGSPSASSVSSASYGSSGSSNSSYPRDHSNFSNPSAPHNSPHCQCHNSPAPQSTPAAPITPAAPAAPATPAAPIAPLATASPAPASAHSDQPLTEADFTDCIKRDDATSNIALNGTPAPQTHFDIATRQVDHLTIPAASISSPSAASKTISTQSPATTSPCLNPAIWPLNHSSLATPDSGILNPNSIIAPPARPAASAPPSEAEFSALELQLGFTIGRSQNIHDPAVKARLVDHAQCIKAQREMARNHHDYFEQICRTKWAAGP